MRKTCNTAPSGFETLIELNSFMSVHRIIVTKSRTINWHLRHNNGISGFILDTERTISFRLSHSLTNTTKGQVTRVSMNSSINMSHLMPINETLLELFPYINYFTWTNFFLKLTSNF